MHTKFLALTAAIALPTTAALAEGLPMLDLTKVCANGCMIQIDLGEGARFGANTELPGGFTASAIQNVLASVSLIFVTNNDEMTYQLVSEPGMPMFMSIEQVTDYMLGINGLISRNQPSG